MDGSRVDGADAMERIVTTIGKTPYAEGVARQIAEGVARQDQGGASGVASGRKRDSISLSGRRYGSFADVDSLRRGSPLPVTIDLKRGPIGLRMPAAGKRLRRSVWRSGNTYVASDLSHYTSRTFTLWGGERYRVHSVSEFPKVSTGRDRQARRPANAGRWPFHVLKRSLDASHASRDRLGLPAKDAVRVDFPVDIPRHRLQTRPLAHSPTRPRQYRYQCPPQIPLDSLGARYASRTASPPTLWSRCAATGPGRTIMCRSHTWTDFGLCSLRAGNLGIQERL